MMQHKESVLPQPASPAAFCHTLSFQSLALHNPSKIFLAVVILSLWSSPEQFREIVWIIVELFQGVWLLLGWKIAFIKSWKGIFVPSEKQWQGCIVNVIFLRYFTDFLQRYQAINFPAFVVKCYCIIFHNTWIVYNIAAFFAVSFFAEIFVLYVINFPDHRDIVFNHAINFFKTCFAVCKIIFHIKRLLIGFRFFTFNMQKK